MYTHTYISEFYILILGDIWWDAERERNIRISDIMIKQITRFKWPTPQHPRQLHPAYATEIPGIDVTKSMFRLSYSSMAPFKI